MAAGARPALSVVNGHGRFEISGSRSRPRVTLDGGEIARDAIEVEGPIVRILDGAREPVLLFGFFPGPGDGQIVYTADLDPATPIARFGFDTEPFDPNSARSLGLDLEHTLVVRRVCPGLAAEQAGLRAGDVIVGVAGQGASTEALYDAAIDGDLRLGVLDGGDEREIRLRGPRQRWPAATIVEDYIRGSLSGSLKERGRRAKRKKA